MQRNNHSHNRGYNSGNFHGRPNNRRNYGDNQYFSPDLSGFETDLLGNKMIEMMNTLNQVQAMNSKKATNVVEELPAMREVSFPADIIEEETHYRLEAELPGFKKKDITLSFSENTVTILAEHKEVKETSVVQYIQRERNESSLSRSFTLYDVEDTHIEASFEDGILCVLLYKKKLEKKSKLIPIE